MSIIQDTRLVWNGLKSLATRAPDAEFVRPMHMGTTFAMGLTDDGRPSEQKVRRFNRGIFSKHVEMRATDIGSALADSMVVRNLSQGDTEEVEISHPWLQLLRRPNPSTSARQLWGWASMVADLQGSAAFVVEDDSRGVPIALHPIYPVFGMVSVKLGPTGAPSGYTFWRADGKKFPMELRDIVMIRHVDPISPAESQSLIEKAAFQLDKTLYADIYERDTLKDGRFPAGYLSTAQDLGEPQAKRMGQAFADAYMTAGKVKSVPVFSSGTKIERSGITPKDMMFIEGREFTAREIMEITGIPEGLFAKDSTNANVRSHMTVYKQFTIQPQADKYAGQLTTAFEVAFGADPGVLEIVAPDVIPIDTMEQARVDEIDLRSGKRSINEVRARDGDEPVDGGDEPRVQAGMIPLTQSFDRAGRDTNDQQRLISRSAAEEDEAEKLWKRSDRAKRLAERPIESMATILFRRQKEEALEKLAEITPDRSTRKGAASVALSAVMLFDLTKWILETISGMDPEVRHAIQSGWNYAGTLFESDAVLEFGDDRIRDAIEAINSKMRDVPGETQSRLARLIQEAFDDDTPLDILAEQIELLFDGFESTRSTAIAETAGGAAFERGHKVHAETAGMETKMWLTRRDGRQRKSHRVMDGVTVGLNETFTVPVFQGDKQIGTEEMDHPLDTNGSAGNVIRCRCTAIYGFTP